MCKGALFVTQIIMNGFTVSDILQNIEQLLKHKITNNQNIVFSGSTELCLPGKVRVYFKSL